MQTVHTQNYKSVDIKFNFFCMGSQSMDPMLAALLQCWTWTEALIIFSSLAGWMSDSELKPLKAISIARTATPFTSSESTRDRDPSLTYNYLYKTIGSLGLVNNGIFQKENCRRLFCTTQTVLKAACLGREVGTPIFGTSRPVKSHSLRVWHTYFDVITLLNFGI